ncbi:hypothetical protein [Flavobacterium sp. KACC 22763]|uniref:hypothetical protein n=1 Tax=Flavobacterium sp. KACC 22763 TaxID=3025668 RepID=UPI0023667E37|nr:hypothetical protein [Flavobacterium sp. KACC 22763]WDF64609.1 hypothetical protein PQ463_00360 [Flavobacterium sp. KACC 22763]
MNFEVLNIRKIDSSTGNFKLHEDYILSYDHFDGWTERSLDLGIYIDIIFDCKVDIVFRKKNFERFEKQFECEIPLEIKNIISEILNLEHLELKHYYSDIFMEDQGWEDYVINHLGKSHNIRIGNLFKKPHPENPSEKLFFDLIELFEKWREEIYQQCLKELTPSIEITFNEKPNRKR